MYNPVSPCFLLLDNEDSSATESGSSVLQPSPAKSPEKKDDNADSRQTLLPPTAETQTQHELVSVLI